MIYKSKLPRYLIIALVCGLIFAINYGNSTETVVGGSFNLESGIEISKIDVIENGATLSTFILNSEGNDLELQITSKVFDVPWTLYTPFFQSGSSSCRLLYRVKVGDKFLAESNISITQTTNRYSFFPRISRKADLNEKGIAEILESAKRNIDKNKK
jgi:hypothetical protein